MSSDTPGPGTPGLDPAQPSAGGPQPGGWPAELVPPEAPATPDPAPAQPAAPAWGQPAPQPAAPGPAPAQPAAPAWGQPAPQPAAPGPAPAQPVAPAWGQPAPQPAAPGPAPAQPAAPAWGQAPAAPPVAAPPLAEQPASPWGAPPPQPQVQAGAPAPPPQQGQWAPPPAQQPAAYAPQPGAPGGPPAAWNPAPAKSGNGCLKACLIVGVILVVLVVLFFAAITLLGMKLASDIGINTDGSMKQCEIITNEQLSRGLGFDAQAGPMQGIVDATLGVALDKRVLSQAPDCWIVPTDSAETGVTGRVARQDSGDAGSVFSKEKTTAESGLYLAKDMSGVGEEAFCTGVSEAASVGVLARQGNRLVYVSLISPTMSTDLETLDNGVVTSASTCALAANVAKEMLR